MASYKGITFAEGYNSPFAKFKKEFESTHVFKSIPENQRDSELKKAHKIATKGNALHRNAKKGRKPHTSKD